MRSPIALATVLFATCAYATTSSSFNVPLKRFKRSGDPGSHAGLSRFRRANWQTTIPATSLASIYTASIGIGNPATYYDLIVDTGSSNTFCGAGQLYNRTSTSILTGEIVNVTYGSGNFTGLEYLDQVTLAPSLVLHNQSIGDAVSSNGFQGLDGILGLGPVDLTNHTLTPDVNATVPTIMNSLVSQGLIKKQILGIYFAPSPNDNDTNSALTFGGADPSLYEGELTYTPVTKTEPSSFYWGINVTVSTYGNYTLIPNSTAGVVDSGTSGIAFAQDFFDVYQNAIPGATYDTNTTLLQIPQDSIPSMQPLDFVIAGRVFTLDAAAQLIPESENTAWGGVPGVRYGLVRNMERSSGKGLDYILGTGFIERYYSVFDASANRIGFAETNNTFGPCYD